MMKRRGARDFPEDVLFDILKRLPAKSLCRLRSVSTSWLSVISDPCFIRSHYALSETSSKLVLLRARSGQPWEWLVYDQDHSKLVAAVKVPNLSSMANHITPTFVNGLICLIGLHRGLITILNPTTREYKSISLPDINPIGRPYRRYLYHYHLFGFDPVAGKHKILCSYIVQSRHPETVLEHWVFTLGSVDDQIWRMVGVNDHSWMSKTNGDVCIDGVIYFMAYINYEPGTGVYVPTLVAFDLKSERLKKAKFSTAGAKDIGPPYKLIEFNGSPALVEGPLYYRVCHINVWVLEDFDKQVWDLKRLVFAPDDWFFGTTGTEAVSFACALRRGEILVFTPHRNEVRPSLDLFFCDTKSRRFWSSRIQVPVGDVFAEGLYTSLIFSEHVESLFGCLASQSQSQTICTKKTNKRRKNASAVKPKASPE